ncbi:fumarate hydratase [Nocardioides agariphilus]|uniref:Fumarate hydratase class I n=1 Tax=Nocardioides agariphilus TaxID=433664 RepID=A0A930VPG3_9ACTN|nr:fumarate hydratase [Nocardioides agariphilus]
MAEPDFQYSDLLPLGPDETPYRLVTTEGVSTFEANGRTFLEVAPSAIRALTAEAMHDISHYLRPAHLAQLRRIIDDPEASGNDRFVALDLLKNVNISAGGVLPMCQDTGTAIVMGKKSEGVLTGADDAEAISLGVYDAYTKLNLRYSQLAPLTMWEEKNTGTNLPAQIELYSTPADAGQEAGHGPEYKFLFMAKGGGSANKSFLYQETKAVLNPQRMLAFLDEKIRSLGTAACPPYHLAVVIGGTSAEYALKTAKYASAHYLDNLPTSGSLSAHGFRDLELEEEVFKLTQSFGIGAQFGGKYFCHDVRVIRLPRHGASCPVALAVSCSADRQALGKITSSGVYLEQLETDPAQYMPSAGVAEDIAGGSVVNIDLRRPMSDILAELSRHPVKTRLSLTGPLVVARDIAHAKIKERLDAGEEMPAYLRDHAVYYAGPAKTPTGMASGSFGPTTAGRMDSYVEQFQAAGGSKVMLAKGNRSKVVTAACESYGGFYLGSIGGPAARLAQDCIRSVEVLEYPELGMEAVWKIEVEDFPAFIVVDDKGNDFFTDPAGTVTVPLSGIRVRSDG